jgi:hypothetical protein
MTQAIAELGPLEWRDTVEDAALRMEEVAHG